MNVMLDLETWSSKPDACIVSIGAVKFDRGGIHDRFHIAIQPTKDRDIDPRTILWWMHTDRRYPLDLWLAHPRVLLATALCSFSKWYGSDPLIPIWGNGATFDNVVLRSAFDFCRHECPWSYKADRCYRTIKNEEDPKGLFLPQNNKDSHDALADAEYQAEHLINIWLR